MMDDQFHIPGIDPAPPVARYPHTFPGFKGTDGTSEEAAKAIAPSVTRLRLITLETVHKLGTATMLEGVAATEFERESLQPRFSELRTMGLLEPTGERRRNPSGKFASVLRLTDAGRQFLHDKG